MAIYSQEDEYIHGSCVSSVTGRNNHCHAPVGADQVPQLVHHEKREKAFQLQDAPSLAQRLHPLTLLPPAPEAMMLLHRPCLVCYIRRIQSPTELTEHLLEPYFLLSIHEWKRIKSRMILSLSHR